MYTAILLAGLVGQQVVAFPWVAQSPGVDSSLLMRKNRLQPRQSACPNNPNHPGAAPITAEFQYCGAQNGLPGNPSCPNNQVPAPGDTAHQYEAPGPNDIRGPCPGINTAANHHFLSHDGITTFVELIDMQQNVYGVGYDLAVLLATLGVGLDGDPITSKMSIGCDATSRTAALGLLGPELGLDGHNHFEGDTSLTRNDYFLAGGDDYSFNQTLYQQMSDTCQGLFNQQNLATYRYERYQQSLADNDQFYFGPKSLLLFGAASFLYELFPSGGNAGTPDQTTEDYFFLHEQLPPNWYSRSEPYTIVSVAGEILAQYLAHPVSFGGNAGRGNFVGVGELGPSISGSMLNTSDPNAALCLLYQIATEDVPSSLSGGVNILSGLSSQVLGFMRGKIGPLQAGSPCPINYNSD